MDSDRLEEWLNQADDASAKHVAARLVRDEIATKWQAKYLMSGRSRLDIGSYRLLERIHQDELGDRFLAIHNSLQRKVDIQVLPSTLTQDESRREEFMQKASLAAKLDHPNLIHVYDIDQEGGRYYLVTEHVEGKTLEATSRSKLSENDVARITHDALSGVTYAHEHDVIHGCIQQADLVLTSDNQVKIQNLTLSPLRQQLAESESAPQAKEDFAAIAGIGLSLLNEISVLDPNPELAEIFAGLAGLDANDAQSVDAATQLLATWLGTHEPLDEELEAIDLGAEGVGGFDQPLAPTSLPRKKNTIDDSDEDLEVVEKPGYLGRLWQDNPVAVIATSAVLVLMLIGGSVFAGMSLLNSSGQEIAKKEAAVNSSTNQTKTPVSTTETITNPVTLLSGSEKKNGTGGLPTKEDMDNFLANIGKQPGNTPPPKTVPQPKAEPKPKNQPPKNPNPKADLKPDVKPEPSKNGNPQGEQPVSIVGTKPPADKPKPDPPATVTPPAPQPAAPVVDNGPVIPDELKRISGIGDTTQQVLYRNGITTYKKLAGMSPEELTAVLEKANFVRANQNVAGWIAGAKKLVDNPNATSTSGPPKKDDQTTKNNPPVDTDSPFANFPRLTDLPPIENTSEVKIADLTIKAQYLLGAEMICEQGVSRTKLIFELNRTKEDKQKWMVGVKRREKEKPTEIAVFRKSENAFHFQWLPEAAKNKFAPFLRNCYVKLILPDDVSTFLTLRKPIRIRDLRLTSEKLVNELDFALDSMPNPDNIVIEVLPLGIKGVETAVPNSRIEKGIPGVLWMKKSDKTGFLWMQVTAEIRSKIQLQSNLMLLVQGQPKPVLSLRALDDLFAEVDRAAMQAQMVHDNAKKPGGMKEDEFKKVKKQLSEDAKKKQGVKKKLIEYQEILPKVLNQPIKVRVYAKLGNLQTLLATTDAKLPQEDK